MEVKNQKPELLYNNDDVKVLKGPNGNLCIDYNLDVKIAVLPYITNDDGSHKFILEKKINEVRYNEFYTLLQGYETKGDGNTLSTVERIVSENTNLTITDGAEWSFLGDLYLSENSNEVVLLFGVGMNKLSLSNKETTKQISIVSADKLVQNNESIVKSAYLGFIYMIKNKK